MERESVVWMPPAPESWEALTWTTFESVEMLWDPQKRTFRSEHKYSSLKAGRSDVSRLENHDSRNGEEYDQFASNPFESSPHMDNEREDEGNVVDHAYIGTQAFHSTVRNESRFIDADEMGNDAESDAEHGPYNEATRNPTPPKDLIR
jgi:hypothetical protein